MLALACAALALPASAAAAKPSPYYKAPFRISTHAYTFGQAPVFMPDGNTVLFGKNFKQGDGMQVYSVALDGSNLNCLTCGQPSGNNVPAPRPQGDWILFHSWRDHHLQIGSPGYGGMGSSLYVMRPDGTHVTKLTGLDPAHGAGEGEDDYHAYWSPDGTKLVWAHLNWNFVDDGGEGKWDVRVADFVDDGVNPPHLVGERVVRPANGHWYETQWWAPDGSGFLYTETWGNAMNTQLFFCKLTASGCQVRQLTDTPAWNEQAIFTPDGKSVIYMSSKDAPGFFNTWAETARAAGLPADADYLLTLPIFYGAFLQPVGEETTDLYQIDLATGRQRRLTTDGRDDGWITPEFTWDPANKKLWWTENRMPPDERIDFAGDPVTELADFANFLSHPPTDPPQTDNALTVVTPIEQRTRVLEFDLKKTLPRR